jgi:GAF domain-containing protein
MTIDTPVGAADRRLADFAASAREMARPTNLEHTLDVVMDRVQQAFLCDAVGILLVDNGHITTAAASEAAVKQVDDLQMSCGEGPCLEAITRRHDHIVHDLRSDSRWLRWGPQAADLGWRSILSLGLSDDERTFGALNLYARQTSFFSTDDLAMGEVFSAHAAIALAGARERGGLLKAVDARHLIGQAQGILMERFSIDAEQAFTVLRRYSSHTNRKLRVVAEDIVLHRRLPDSPVPPDSGAARGRRI